MPQDPRPLTSYAAFVAAYGALMGTFLYRHRSGFGAGLPERVGVGDLALCAAATQRLSRMIAKDEVLSPIRKPFTELEGESPIAAEGSERPTKAGSGLRRAVGRLVSCPYCLSQWVATGFIVGLVEAPRETRFVAATLAMVTASDFLQAGYRRILD